MATTSLLHDLAVDACLANEPILMKSSEKRRKTSEIILKWPFATGGNRPHLVSPSLIDFSCNVWQGRPCV